MLFVTTNRHLQENRCDPHPQAEREREREREGGTVSLSAICSTTPEMRGKSPLNT